MKIYLVGGAVRDKLLRHPFHERDWVVVGSSPKEMQTLGYRAVGKDFPVFLHPDSKEEYALARTERKTAPGYTGFQFHCAPTVSLEDDLLRRDLTINAMAQDDDGNLIDPYNGRRDLDAKLLRHVSDAFREDPVRILRIARFAARYHHLGFKVADDTRQLMSEMVAAGEVDHLVNERVWKEMQRALGEQTPHIFIQVLRDCGALARIIPELDALFGVPQPPQHHPEIDCGLHALLSLQQACRLSDDERVRFAALMHDLGKATTPTAELPRHIGHEPRSGKLVKGCCQRMAVPKEFRELAVQVAELHTHCHRARELTAKSLVKLFQNLDIYRRPDRLQLFLLSCEADARGRTGFENTNYPQADYLRGAAELCRGVNAQQLLNEGLSGKALGEGLERRRKQLLQDYQQQASTASD